MTVASKEQLVPKTSAFGSLSVILCLALAGTAVSALAQDGAAAGGPAGGQVGGAQGAAKQAAEDRQKLDDFVHYVRINRYDLAKAFGEALLARIAAPAGTATEEGALSATEFARLVESSSAQAFTQVTSRAAGIAEVEGVAARLERAYSEGKLAQARDPKEISASIALLTGTARNRDVGRTRLLAAGEYAMPQLLTALRSRGGAQSQLLQSEVRSVIVDLGAQAVMPLAAALPAMDPVGQELVAGILGQINYETAVPFLYDLHRAASQPGVKGAAERAIRSITGSFEADANVAEKYRALAEAYYEQRRSLLSFPGETHQLLWNFDPGAGLFATPVVTPVYHEAAAMRLAEQALRQDPTSAGALSLWLAANFNRETETPQGYENPAYPAGKRDATYFAVAAGPNPSQRVLARALDSKNTPLARKAIGVIERTAGPAAMASPDMERRPLLEALRYPSRRVQYEAALAVAAARPTQSFDGSDRVVPILGSAIRDVSAKFALVLASDRERAESLAVRLREQGYTVLPTGVRLSDREAEIAAAPGIDLLVTDLPAQSTAEAIREARGRTKLGATPILAVLSAESQAEVRPAAGADTSIAFSRDGADQAQFAEGVRQLVEATVGSAMSAEEAADYQTRALGALRDLSLAGGGVFNVADATLPLVAALGQAQGGLKGQVADVLARINEPRAQVALADAALGAQGEEMTALMVRLTDSAKRFGNQLEPRQVKRLLELAGSASDQDATTVAALLGALNLPNDNLIPLIVGAR